MTYELPKLESVIAKSVLLTDPRLTNTEIIYNAPLPYLLFKSKAVLVK